MQRTTKFACLLALPLALLLTPPAVAKNWKDDSGPGWQGKDKGWKKHRWKGNYKQKHKKSRRGEKHEWEDGECTYKYKSGKHGYREERKCKRVRRRGGGPPPWAPAHGYRRNHGEYRRDRMDTAYVPPFDLNRGHCDRTALGAVLGAATGGAVGSAVGKGDGRTAAIIGGTILGALVGGSIGNAMDRVDQNCVGQVLEHARDGEAINWNSRDSRSDHKVIPVKTYQDTRGRYCREYQTVSVVGGRQRQSYGTACRQPDGAWQLIN